MPITVVTEFFMIQAAHPHPYVRCQGETRSVGKK